MNLNFLRKCILFFITCNAYTVVGLAQDNLTVKITSTITESITNKKPIPIRISFNNTVKSDKTSGFKVTDVDVTGGTLASLMGSSSIISRNRINITTAEDIPGSPTAVAVGPDGNIYVADQANSSIKIYTPGGSLVKKFGGLGDGDGQLSNPEGIAVSADGTIYVADTKNNRVQVFDKNGNFKAKFGSKGTGNYQFDEPVGIFVNSSKEIFVTDRGNGRIMIFKPSYLLLRIIGAKGQGNNQLNRPTGIAVDKSERIYIADSDNSKIKVFDRSGALLRIIGEFGNTDGKFVYPSGVAVDAENNLYVIDQQLGLQIFNADGSFKRSYFNTGSGDDQVKFARGIAVDAAGQIYVADYANNRIQILGDGSYFTGNITPTITNGAIKINIPANKAFTLANTGNLAAPEFSINFDETRPTVSISSNVSGQTDTAFTANFTFDKLISDFGLEDIVVKNGRASNLTEITPGLAYRAKISPVTPGTMFINVLPNAVKDKTDNYNDLSDTLTVVYARSIATPGNFIATGEGGQIRISWNPVANAAKYKLFYGTDAGTPESIEVTDTTYLHTNLFNGTKYYYALIALDANNNESFKTAVISATSFDASGPQPPQNIVLQQQFRGVTIAWDEVPGAYRYILKQGATENVSEMVTIAQPFYFESRNYINQNLAAGTTYYYAIASYFSDDSTSPYVIIPVITPPVVVAEPDFESSSITLRTKAGTDLQLTNSMVGGQISSIFFSGLPASPAKIIRGGEYVVDVLGNSTFSSGTNFEFVSPQTGTFAFKIIPYTNATVGSSTVYNLKPELHFNVIVEPDVPKPSDIMLSSATIDENNVKAATIGFLSSRSTDSTSNSFYKYSLINGLGSANNGQFMIVDNELKAVNSFDYESKPTYSIRVRTTDENNNSFDKQFVIAVNDVQEDSVSFVGSWKGLNTSDGKIPASAPGTVLQMGADANGFVYALYINENQQAVLGKITSRGMENLGEPFSISQTSYPSFIIDPVSQAPHLSYADPSANVINVKKYNGTAWVNYGPPISISSSISSNSLSADKNGYIFVAYATENAGATSVVIKRNFRNANSWNDVIHSDLAGADSVKLVAYGSGEFFVSYVKNTKLYIKKYNGGSWSDTNFNGDTQTGKITLDHDNLPYVAYVDHSKEDRITVARYTGSAWEITGEPGFTNPASKALDLTIDERNVPYLIYQNLNPVQTSPSSRLGKSSANSDASDQIIIMPFVNGSWIDAGSIMTNSVNQLSILTGYGQLYAGYNNTAGSYINYYTESDGPSDLALDYQSVEEKKPTNTFVGQFSSSYSYVNSNAGILTYSLTADAEYPDNLLFAISGDTLKTASIFDYAIKNSYRINVRIEDVYGAGYEEAFDIAINKEGTGEQPGSDPETETPDTDPESVRPNTTPTLAAITNTTICYTPATQSIALSGITAGAETDQVITLSVNTDNTSLFDILEVIRNGSTGALNYKLRENASGTAVVMITVKDNGGTEYGGTDTFSQSFVLSVNPLPIAEIITTSTSISKGETITLTATGGTSYQWSTGETSQSITVRPTQSSNYQVTVSSGSCSSTALVNVEVKNDYMALNGTNIMSPNGDGINDNFIIRNIDMYPNNTVTIYDNAGRVLYKKVNYKDEWNGTFDGSPLEEGTYYYIVDFGNVASPIKGYITIVRD